MAQLELSSEFRANTGKGVARKLRAIGKIPGVLYGPTIQAVHLSLEEKTVATLIQSHGLNSIIKLTVEGADDKTHLCMVKDVQKDVFQKKVLHLDLRRIDLKEKIEVGVRLHFEGEQVLRAKGAIVEQLVRIIHIKTVPANIPEVFTVDISNLRPGQTISVGEVQLPEDVELIHDPAAPVVNISAARGAALATAEA
jgi:large subunit ribosomal protein L25